MFDSNKKTDQGRGTPEVRMLGQQLSLAGRFKKARHFFQIFLDRQNADVNNEYRTELFSSATGTRLFSAGCPGPLGHQLRGPVKRLRIGVAGLKVLCNLVTGVCSWPFFLRSL